MTIFIFYKLELGVIANKESWDNDFEYEYGLKSFSYSYSYSLLMLTSSIGQTASGELQGAVAERPISA